MRRVMFLLIGALSAPYAHAGEPPPGFARLADVAPTIVQEMRYAGADNFTGAPVPGYDAPQCWLRTEAAKALAAAQKDARARGISLVVYDCYRPLRAVSAFVDWSRNADQRTKTEHYPRLAKSALFPRGLYRRTFHPFDGIGRRYRRQRLEFRHAVRFFRYALMDES